MNALCVCKICTAPVFGIQFIQHFLMLQITRVNWLLQGPWIHPEIDNPEYSADTQLYKRDEICAIGFDLWQVKSGTIFDNVLITDDPEYAKKVGEDVWRPTFVSIM
jgi:hypothetical protein